MRVSRLTRLAAISFVISCLAGGPPNAAKAIVWMPDEERNEAERQMDCLVWLMSARHMSEQPAGKYVNDLAGFRSQQLIDPDLAKELVEVRDTYERYRAQALCKSEGQALQEGEERDGFESYLRASHADSYASLKLYQSIQSSEPLKVLAHLRAIRQIASPLTDEHNERPWSRYHTAPVIERTISWIEENGEGLGNLDDDALFELARELTEEAGYSEQELSAVTRALEGSPLVREEGPLDDYQIRWDTAVPAETAVRIEAALAHLGVRNVDLAELQNSRTRDN